LSTGSVPQGSCEHEASQPPTVADVRFCELVAADMGVKVSTARTAFIGEATERVRGVASWALDRSPDPDERGKMILAWAKKRGCGAFRTHPDEYVSLAGGGRSFAHMASRHENEALAHLLLQYWCANPKRLARLLDEVEIWINVRDEGTRSESGNGAGA
jgi:hypothetical protein